LQENTPTSFLQNNVNSLILKKTANESAFEDKLGKFNAARICM